MGQRYTRQDVEAKTKRFATLLGVPFGHYAKGDDDRFHAVIGALDVSGAYGGWAVHRITNISGGVDDVFRSGHVPARQLCEMLDAACNAIYLEQSIASEREDSK